MSAYALEYDLDQVFPFVKSLLPGLARSDGMTTIGLRRDGELIAGAIYEGINGRNAWIHIAAIPGRRWMTRGYLHACFAYPFVVCGLDRLSGYVNESNLAAREFDEHLGFEEETRLRGAAPDGGDVILYVMWKKDCRYVA